MSEVARRGERLPWRAITGALVLGSALAALVLGFVASPLRVEGPSMNPTLANGSVALVLWTDGARRRVGPGSIVVAEVPAGAGGGRVVKRVMGIKGAAPRRRFTLEGDNRERSRDSRRFGELPESQILGVVVARVAPRPRYWGVVGPGASRAEGSRDALSPAGR